MAKSKHLPEVSSGLAEAVTGTEIIDTGLRDLVGFTCALSSDAVANASSVSYEVVAQVAGQTRKVTLKAWKADGATAASVATTISWIALGN